MSMSSLTERTGRRSPAAAPTDLPPLSFVIPGRNDAERVRTA